MPNGTIPSNDRESQVLRASVIEAAFSLGPKVANLIFNDSIAEEEGDTLGSLQEVEEDVDFLSTPGLTSASSEDSHSSGFFSHDGHRGLDISKIRNGSHPEISLPLRLGAASKTTLVDGFYLNSPFVVVNEGQFPPSSTSLPVAAAASDPQTPPRKKKALKAFRFTPRKRNKEKAAALSSVPASTPSVESNQSSMRTFRVFPNLDDPIESPPSSPSPVSSPPRSFTPVSAPSPSINNSVRVTPSKLRKQVSRQRDWDFKDPDRPSFFLDQQYVSLDSRDAPSMRRSASMTRDKPRTRRNRSDFDEDAGYLSEGSGLRQRGRAKTKGSPGESSSKGLFSMRKWPSGDMKKESSIPPLPVSKAYPISLPIAARFARYGESIHSPDSSMSSTSRSYNSTGFGSSRRDTLSSAASSFALMPDLNAAKRLGLDKYASRNNGAIGNDNDIKLEMLAKLLAERPIPRLEPEDTARMLSRRGSMYKEEPVERPPVPILQVDTSFRSQPGRNEYERGRGREQDPDRLGVQRQQSRSRSRPAPARKQEKRERRDPDYYDSGYRSGLERGTRDPYYDSRDVAFAERAVSPRTQSPIRGKQQPFPVKSILRNAPRVQPTDARLLYVPIRYDGLQVDVPRSVKSSYSKDLLLEQEFEEDDDPEEDPDDEDSDSLSVYSRYTKYLDDDDAASRASFMDPERSGRARDRLVGGVFGTRDREY